VAASSIAAFWVVSVLLVLIPGADWAYVIGTGLRGGPVPMAVGGLVLGYAALTAVVAAGLAALVARTPAALTVLTVLGAAYLIWLGAATLARPPAAHPEVGAPPGRAAVVKGAGISALNPKGLLLFLALLPQFTWTGWPLAGQIALLGAVHMLNCGAVYLGVGFLARAILRARPAAARALTRFSGAAMVLIGVLLLAGRLMLPVWRRPLGQAGQRRYPGLSSPALPLRFRGDARGTGDGRWIVSATRPGPTPCCGGPPRIPASPVPSERCWPPRVRC